MPRSLLTLLSICALRSPSLYLFAHPCPLLRHLARGLFISDLTQFSRGSPSLMLSSRACLPAFLVSGFRNADYRFRGAKEPPRLPFERLRAFRGRIVGIVVVVCTARSRDCFDGVEHERTNDAFPSLILLEAALTTPNTGEKRVSRQRSDSFGFAMLRVSSVIRHTRKKEIPSESRAGRSGMVCISF